MDLAVGNYASADFTDSDAGAGGTNIDSLQGFIDIKTAIQNLVDSTSNIVESTMDDYRKKLESQRNGLKLLCSAENLAIFDFELSIPEMQQIDTLDRHRRFNDPGNFCEKAFNTFFPIFD